MNTNTKRALATGLMLLGIGMWSSKAQATNNPDTMTVSVTPNVTYGVSIASVSSAGYDFQTVALGATTVSTSPVVLTNTGNIAEYFSMAISSSSGNWGSVIGTPGTDQFRMVGRFSATQPSSTTFNTSDALDTTAPLSAHSLYGQANTKTIPTGTQQLWLRLEMPTRLINGTTAAQTMTLTVNGQGT